ncbi:MAG: class I SAM-dependent methyltransferase [Deltaproteobacteria bacterium]|nr:class I SAM-dependent methyltransferase [Deltaproteobacteria bacterium]
MKKLIAAFLVLAGCVTAPNTSSSNDAATHAAPANYDAVVAAPDRTDADRALDPGRKPAAFLAAIAPAPGMNVGELFAGGGYTTELLARVVAPSGKVYAENPKWVLEKFAAKPWADRLARPVNANVVREDTELDAPFPNLDGQLDRVVTNANYHDAVWAGVDLAKMNAAVFTALKPGGWYIVADSSAKPGTGLQDAKTLHRIDETVVRQQVEAAGFHFLRADESLRNPADTRDWNASPSAAKEKRGTSDRFIFVFEKPAR